VGRTAVIVADLRELAGERLQRRSKRISKYHVNPHDVGAVDQRPNISAASLRRARLANPPDD
jgi:hypothetical protein